MAYEATEEVKDPADTKASKGKLSLKEIHKTALEEFELCQDAESDNRKEALDDLRFARLGEQWYEEDKRQRELEHRPCMTFNRMPVLIRSIVNDGRQNKPAIKVHPADDSADTKTAEVINGLIRNIEYSSNSEVAYDTGLDSAASCGIGYWRVGMEYSHDDTFDMDLEIQPIPNVFSVYGDYASTCADSSDWNIAFVVTSMPIDEFERKYKGAEKVDFQSEEYRNMPGDWMEEKNIVVAEYWCRKQVPRTIVLLSSGEIVEKEWLSEVMDETEGIPEGVTNGEMLGSMGITPTGQERQTTGYEVTQYIMNGVEIIDEVPWKGRYIPIVPVYGEVVVVEGKRYFRSAIRDAKDAQRNFNYWRTTSTELVALAPKTPFIGMVGQFDTDREKWESANTTAHPFIEYDNAEGSIGAPQRQPFAGVPAGALQEAANSADDIKATTGIYDAALGARSNETSGRAINARKIESDTGTFHFVDNQARAIRHTGRILIDLIPHVYSKARVIRIMGADKVPQNVSVNQQLQPGQAQQDEDGIAQIYDLTAGKYDLTVDVGPGFQTKREEAAYGMTEMVRNYPASGPVIAAHLAKAQDWPGADEIAKELAVLAPGADQQNPALQQAQQQLQQLQQQIQQAGQQLQEAQKALKDKADDHATDREKMRIDAYKAETDRLKALGVTLTPEAAAAMGMQTMQSAQQALTGPDLLPAQLSQGQSQAVPQLPQPPQMQPPQQPAPPSGAM